MGGFARLLSWIHLLARCSKPVLPNFNPSPVLKKFKHLVTAMSNYSPATSTYLASWPCVVAWPNRAVSVYCCRPDQIWIRRKKKDLFVIDQVQLLQTNLAIPRLDWVMSQEKKNTELVTASGCMDLAAIVKKKVAVARFWRRLTGPSCHRPG